MSIIFRVILVLVSLGTFFYMMKKIRQSKVQIEDSIFWILFSVVLIVISIFPQIPDFFAELMGIYSTVNLVFLVIIFVLLAKNFYMSIHISQLDYKIKSLSQEIALNEHNRNSEKFLSEHR